ncbi:MAG: uroporphyrinogen decarboxylase family protein [Desulfobacterales bacterium]|nr:MAG: uroporphyrinogen decarboxylase family protein [Desulfobacterales bacterium]
MQNATGKYYMITALKRKYSDRLPTTVLIGPYCSRFAGYSVREILTDAQKSAEAHLAFYDRFKPDSLIVYNDIYLETEAMGCELEFPEDQISHPKKVLLENKAHLAKLDVPNPKKDGRLPYFLEVCERVSSQVRKEATMGLGHSGPWNLAMHLRGAESLLLDTIDDPEFVHELMQFTTNVVQAVGDALIEARFQPSIGEAYATCSLISPQIYKDFIKPYHIQLCDYFKSKGAFMSLHICGETDPIMEDIIDTGIAFFSLDAPSSLKRLLEAVAGKIPVMGNVPTTLFSSGTYEEMESAIRHCIDTAAEGSGYILASGCEIPLDSTEDRVAHFFEYSHQYGREFMIKMREQNPERFQD